MLDLRRLQVLHEFAHQGSIAATARSLGYTASAISQQLSTLEREVGTPLLDRTARSAELTDSGRMLAERAGQILAMVEAAESLLAASASEPSGRVTVTAFPSAAVAFAPRLAPRLRQYKNVQLVVRQAAEGTGARQVSSGDVDIALVDEWGGGTPDDGAGKLRSYHLLRDPMILVVPKGHRLADPEQPVELSALLAEPWIIAAHGEPSRYGTEQLLAHLGGAPVAAWEFEGLGTILSLVARGIGIAAVPSLALTSGTAGLRFRHLPQAPPSRDIYAVARAASVSRPSVKVTLRALRDVAEDVQRTLASALDGAPAH